MHVILPCDIQVQLFLVQKMKIIMGRVCMWRKWKMEWLHARLMMWWKVDWLCALDEVDGLHVF
jgi:hypothetical protein